jgi:hypothetical protein
MKKVIKRLYFRKKRLISGLVNRRKPSTGE